LTPILSGALDAFPVQTPITQRVPETLPRQLVLVISDHLKFSKNAI
jgi:hypothetical protein